MTTTEDAIARAMRAANVALDADYARRGKTADKGVHPAHTGPWVQTSEARAEGDAKRGWTIKFSRVPPAGFSVQAVVTVSGTGDVKVKSAEATFSPD